MAAASRQETLRRRADVLTRDRWCEIGDALLIFGGLATVGDMLTTWLVMRDVPGGRELNGLMAGLMGTVGLDWALALRGIIGLIYAYFAREVVSGRFRGARRSFSARPGLRPLLAVALAAPIVVLWFIDFHNLALVTAGH